MLIYLFLLLCVLCQALAQIFGKYAALTISAITVYDLISNPFLYASFFTLAFQALFWQLSLKKVSLVTAYFAMSLLYPLLMIFSVFIFNEKATLPHILGAIIITAGVFIFTKEIKTR